MTDDGVRLWAALNILRRSALDTYTTHIAYASGQDSSDGEGRRTAQRFGWSLLAVAFGLSLLSTVWTGEEAGSWLLLAAATFGGVGVLCLYIAVQLRRSHARRRQARALYLEGEAERSRYRAVLERLASSWRGSLSEAGISTTVQFLTEHWPAAAPFVPMRAFRSYGEDRLTVTGQMAGRPVLVQTLDFWPPLPAVTLPLLVLFVAGQPEWPEPAAAGDVLTRLGLQYGRNRAGTWAIHRGPATAVLADEPLDDAIKAMVQLSGPPPSRVPAPPPVTLATPAPSRDTAESFLRALAERDLLAVIERAHVNLFTSWFGEPFDEDFDQAIDNAQARPVRWWLRGSLGASDGDMEYGYRAMFADGSSGGLAVFVTAQADRFLVAGYTVRGNRVLGVEYGPT